MSDYLFLFDLDSTITKKEILPTVSEKIGKSAEMRALTEATMQGEIPFKTSFLHRVDLLKGIDVRSVADDVAAIPVNENIVQFITQNKDRCCVVTGNLDCWIGELMAKIGIADRVYCSKTQVTDGQLKSVISVIDKELTAKQFVQPLVVIGDGDNDSGMAKCAEIAVGFGGVRKIAPSLLRNIDFAFYDDKRCADFLRTLL